jgi:hypothetical protein
LFFCVRKYIFVAGLSALVSSTCAQDSYCTRGNTILGVLPNPLRSQGSRKCRNPSNPASSMTAPPIPFKATDSDYSVGSGQKCKICFWLASYPAYHSCYEGLQNFLDFRKYTLKVRLSALHSYPAADPMTIATWKPISNAL